MLAKQYFETNYKTILFLLISFAVIGLCFNKIIMFDFLKLDFKTFFYSGTVFSIGGNIYDYTVLKSTFAQTGEIYPYIYTPLLAEIFSFFSAVNPYYVQIAWTILSLISIPLIFLVNIKTLEISYDLGKIPYYKIIIVIFSLILLIKAPFRYIIIVGQIDILILLLISAGLHLSAKKRDIPAGLILAFAIFLKYSSVVLILYFLFTKKFKMLMAFISGIIFLTFMTYIISPEQFGNFLSFLLNSSQSEIEGLPVVSTLINNSVISQFYKFFGEDPVSKAGGVILSFVILAFPLYKLIKSKYEDNTYLYLLPVLIASVLFPPYVWRQHFVYLVPGILFFASFILNKTENIKQRILFLIVLIILSPFDFNAAGYIPNDSNVGFAAKLFAVNAFFSSIALYLYHIYFTKYALSKNNKLFG